MLVYASTLCKKSESSYFLDKAVGMQKLCHLDLKPANIVLDKNFEIL